MTYRTTEECDRLRDACIGPCWTTKGFWTTKTLLAICAAFIVALGSVAGIAIVNAATITTYRDAQDKQTKMIVDKIDKNHIDIKERIADVRDQIKARE